MMFVLGIVVKFQFSIFNFPLDHMNFPLPPYNLLALNGKIVLKLAFQSPRFDISYRVYIIFFTTHITNRSLYTISITSMYLVHSRSFGSLSG